MSVSVAQILQEVKNRGELTATNTEEFNIIARISNKHQEISLCGSGCGFIFEKRFYVYWKGGWYDATNHPHSPFPELRDKKPGYHKREIVKREFGTLGKITEELEELTDAKEQGVKIMELVELSDLVGAIEGYLENNHPGISLQDLIAMSEVTQRAFKNGRRN